MSRLAAAIPVVVLLLVAGSGGSARAQATPQGAPDSDSTGHWSDTAWTPIVEKGGVRFSYIFYGKADNYNNGVVVRLENENDTAVRYDFTIIFRGPDGEASARAQGRLAAGEMKTGEKDGLFWIPFRDGRSIGEVGLRGITVVPTNEEPS